MKHIVMYSGGVSSWAAAMRVKERYGTDDLILLFTDTKMEDEDLYRFLDEGAAVIGVPVTNIADGRDPFEVFQDEKFMGNSRIDPCSKRLKRELADKWIKRQFKPDECRMYVGIDWTEEHRFTRLADRKLPYVYEAPLCEEPYLTKKEQLDWLQSYGVRSPRLYDMGFPHNNCGGFCIKAGLKHFKHLYEQMPERYLEMEWREQGVYNKVPNAKPFLKKQEKGVTKYLSLKQYRLQYLEPQCEIDETDWGGCGCFVDRVGEDGEAAAS